MPRDVDYLYTRANVRDGKFVYSSASEKTHYSTAMVSWSDPQNGYQDAVEPVFDHRLIRRFQVRQADVTAIGCTRQSEAIRRGKWILHTNEYDRMVSFTVGLDGKIPLPGYVIGVADEMLAGRVLGGRLHNADGRNITLDRVSSAKVGERLILNLPSGKAEGRTIQAVNGKVITVTTTYSETPIAESVWAIDATDLAIQLFRVTGIKEGDDGVSFEITAIEHNPDKYAHIDTGIRIDERPISLIPPGVQSPPKNVVISSDSVVHQGIAITTLRVTWDAAESAITYEAEWRRDNGNWIAAPRTSTQGFEVPNIYAGRYQARVRAINAAEISSLWANAPETHLKGKAGEPPAPLGFKATPIVFGIQLDWDFAPHTDDTLKTEIQYSPTSDGEGLMLLADIPYPQKTYVMQGLAAGVAFYFRARLVDKSGNPSPWTDFLRGESSTDASWITDAVGDQLMTAEAGRRLQAQLDYQAEADLINGVAIQQNSFELMARDGENKAEIRRLDRVFADREVAWAQSIKEVKSSVGENRSSIQENQKSINKLDLSFAESEQRVQAQLKDQQAIISTKMQAEFNQPGNGYAIHSVNITLKHNGVKYNAGGMVISGEIKNGQLESYIGFSANNFAFYNPANGKMEPFMVAKNGQLFVQDAFIDVANIRKLVVGDEIKSANFDPRNRTGFRLDMRTGEMTSYGQGSGGYWVETNNLKQLFDSRGRLRIRMGFW